MTYELPALPYDYNALGPHISAKTLEFHHDKHHNTYVNTYNSLVEEAGMADKSIEAVIKETFDNPSHTKLFNNAAQAWNHTFYWNCMKPSGGGSPSGELADKINRDLNGLDQLKQDLKSAGTGQFGSGYAWLVLARNGRLEVTKTANAINPMVHNQVPLIAIDVWEHAYYLDYQNARGSYVDTFMDHLVNWDFVGQQLEAAKQMA